MVVTNDIAGYHRAARKHVVNLSTRLNNPPCKWKFTHRGDFNSQFTQGILHERERGVGGGRERGRERKGKRKGEGGERERERKLYLITEFHQLQNCFS